MERDHRRELDCNCGFSRLWFYRDALNALHFLAFEARQLGVQTDINAEVQRGILEEIHDNRTAMATALVEDTEILSDCCGSFVCLAQCAEELAGYYTDLIDDLVEAGCVLDRASYETRNIRFPAFP